MEEKRTSLEVIAPTVDEAIARGSAELGASPDALEVEVLDEGSRGFLGISGRQARVRLTLKSPAEQVAPEAAQPEPAAEIPAAELDQAVQVSQGTVTELIQRMGIKAQVTARWGEKDPGARIRPLLVDVSGDDLGILIGRRGETLSALQYITRLIVAKELQEPVAVVIDIEGYRARRERQLRRLARRMADQAIELGRTMVLEPMPANERRIIHIELREHASVTTESIGEGNRRKVTIIPKS